MRSLEWIKSQDEREARKAKVRKFTLIEKAGILYNLIIYKIQEIIFC